MKIQARDASCEWRWKTVRETFESFQCVGEVGEKRNHMLSKLAAFPKMGNAYFCLFHSRHRGIINRGLENLYSTILQRRLRFIISINSSKVVPGFII